MAIGDIIKKVLYKPDDFDPYNEAENRLDPSEDSDRYDDDEDNTGDEV